MRQLDIAIGGYKNLMRDNNSHGYMVISLDFELMWGILDHKDPIDYEENIKNVRIVIPRLLDLFSKYKIHVTWAVVGMALNENIDECKRNVRNKLPTYRDKRLSSYNHLHYLSKVDANYLFLKDLLDKIKEVDGQELGTHTYSHYYCLEEGQTAEQFEDDLNEAIEISANNGFSIRSIVFPRNQFNKNYAKILKKYGIIHYRGNESAWFYEATDKKRYKSLPFRICRLVDNYIPLAGNCCYEPKDIHESNGLINLPASRFFRPYSRRLKYLEKARIERIKGQMRYAALNGQIFHLWWHPHNFGKNIDENLRNLEEVLKYYRSLNRKYSFESKSMGEFS